MAQYQGGRDAPVPNGNREMNYCKQHHVLKKSDWLHQDFPETCVSSVVSTLARWYAHKPEQLPVYLDLKKREEEEEKKGGGGGERKRKKEGEQRKKTAKRKQTWKTYLFGSITLKKENQIELTTKQNQHCIHYRLVSSIQFK